jgi:hypothetical protein
LQSSRIKNTQKQLLFRSSSIKSFNNFCDDTCAHGSSTLAYRKTQTIFHRYRRN